MKRSEKLLCLFTAQVHERDGSYVIEVPEREVTVGELEAGDTYRVGMLSPATAASTGKPESAPERDREEPAPPVEEGEVVDVEIEDIGEQGDGIARVGPGYVVIVPETERGERVAAEITDVRENMAFAEVVDRYDQIR